MPGTALRIIFPLHCVQLAMPLHERIRIDDRRNPIQGLSAEPYGLSGKSPAFIIGQSQPTTAQMRLEKPILFNRVGNLVLLVAVDPASDRQDQHLKWDKSALLGAIDPRVSSSLRRSCTTIMSSDRTGSSGLQ